MPTKARRIKQELKQLRAECIDGQTDLVLKRVAYEMETAVRYAIEPVVSWPSLTDMAKCAAQLIRTELRLQRETYRVVERA